MSATPLKIVLLQQSLVWEDVDANLDHFGNLVLGLTQDVDVVMLPEMFSTGFSMRPQIFAKESQEKSLVKLAFWAKEKDVAICGSLMVTQGLNYFNRFFWVEPNGEFQFYDKAHLFRMGEENLHYSKGSSRTVIHYKGWRIAPFVCYDLRFPVWLRRTKTFEYDLMLIVANWPERRAHHWKALCMARAIENQCYLAAVNRIGLDANQIPHSGDSRIIGPTGELIYDAQNSNEIQVQQIFKKEVEIYREQFQAIEDADFFELY